VSHDTGGEFENCSTDACASKTPLSGESTEDAQARHLEPADRGSGTDVSE
jgi:hypothetical protein